MNKSRREFTTGGLLASAGLLLNKGAEAIPNANATTVLRKDKTEHFVKKMGLRLPIVQAVFGGAVPELAAAVSNAGGMGGIGVTWSSEIEVRSLVKRTKDLTSNPFAIGYVLQFGANTLHSALDAGAPVIQFSFGTPDSKQISAIRSAGAKFGMQISTALGARQALDVGADYISVQGQEAGGHIQAQGSWRDQLSQILDITNSTPVLVAGGLSTGKDLREILMIGASGGVFGTRFVASQEYPAHSEYKRRLISARSSDTALTICFDGAWAGALHRVLRNQTLERWEAAGSKSEGLRPGEGEIVGTIGDMKFERYSIFPALLGTTGEPTEMAMYAGLGVTSINDIPSASDLVNRIWAECNGIFS